MNIGPLRTTALETPRVRFVEPLTGHIPDSSLVLQILECGENLFDAVSLASDRTSVRYNLFRSWSVGRTSLTQSPLQILECGENLFDAVSLASNRTSVRYNLFRSWSVGRTSLTQSPLQVIELVCAITCSDPGILECGENLFDAVSLASDRTSVRYNLFRSWSVGRTSLTQSPLQILECGENLFDAVSLASNRTSVRYNLFRSWSVGRTSLTQSPLQVIELVCAITCSDPGILECGENLFDAVSLASDRTSVRYNLFRSWSVGRTSLTQSPLQVIELVCAITCSDPGILECGENLFDAVSLASDRTSVRYNLFRFWSAGGTSLTQCPLQVIELVCTIKLVCQILECGGNLFDAVSLASDRTSILECGGNLFDAVSLAVKAALHNTHIPQVKAALMDGGQVDIHLSDDPFDCWRIDVSTAPLLVTLCKIGDHCVVDPTAEEELCSNASVVVGVTPDGNITSVFKTGAGSFHPQTLVDTFQSTPGGIAPMAPYQLRLWIRDGDSVGLPTNSDSGSVTVTRWAPYQLRLWIRDSDSGDVCERVDILVDVLLAKHTLEECWMGQSLGVELNGVLKEALRNEEQVGTRQTYGFLK
uniref:Ribosomal RNA-processing protein 42 n=1 Tax=Timema shepardi TaxID=629360 RepID=A0A7R9B170_TIMSH|nr:unnamed protein product [Timema shepardi]